MGLDAPLRIGVLTHWLSRRGGGIPEAVYPVSADLAGRGCDIRIFGLAKTPCPDVQARARPRVRIRPLAPIPPLGFGFAPGLQRRLAHEDLDLVHVHGLWTYASLASLRWSDRQKRPHVVSPHGMLDAWAVRNAAWKKRLVGRWFENAHLVSAACLHALSPAEALSFRAYGLQNPICVLPNGIDPPAPATSPPAWQAELNERARVLLFLGRLHPKKGLSSLIRALAKIRRENGAGREWTLIVAGWDQCDHERELKKLAAELGVARAVKFVGPQFEQAKAASLAFADAFVLPSMSEGLPVAVLEAWSYGLPVLMTEACNLPEGFAAGAAMRIEAQASGIEQGLEALFSMSDAERRDMGERGRRLVCERFAWPRIGDGMKQVYEWVLGGGPPPACVVSD